MGYLGFRPKENILRLSIKPLNYMRNGVDVADIDGLTGLLEANGCENLLNITRQSLRISITFRFLPAERPSYENRRSFIGDPRCHWRRSALDRGSSDKGALPIGGARR
jgi:hypothetical protein